MLFNWIRGWHTRRERDRLRDRRKFQPNMEGVPLEKREVLSTAATPFVIDQYLLSHPAVAKARAFGNPPNLSKNAHRYHGPVYDTGNVATQTARGGQAVIVGMPDGSHFRVSIQIADNVFDGGLSAETSGSGTLAIPSIPTQPVGTVRAYGMPGGKVGLIVDGTTANSQLEIDPLAFPQRKGYAHSFAYGSQGRSQILQIGSLNVTSGQIGAIIGYKDADLSGPLTVGGTTTVDRIALDALLPGAAIGVGGTLNTLDIYKGIDLTSGPGITIGRDLNLLNVGNDITLANGASIKVGRFIGLVPQPPKGTATGSNFLSLNQSQIGTGTAQLTPSVSANVQGSVNIGTGSVLSSGAGIANSSIGSSSTTTTPSIFLISGSLNVFSTAQISIPGFQDGNGFNTFATGIVPPTQNNQQGIGVLVNNVIHRNGASINGVPVLSIASPTAFNPG